MDLSQRQAARLLCLARKTVVRKLAVEYKTRRILGFEVSPMAVKSALAQIALKKYPSLQILQVFAFF